jgi:polyhydroxybutyrate depolymerase
VVLHGYGAGGVVMDALVGMGRVAEEKGAFYVAPDGSRDAQGKLFWNATDACCDFGRTGVDDVAYITGLVREIQAAYAIDPKRIHVMGHSNGGFMANRLACDRADVFATAVSFAGANWSDPSRCAPSEPVGFLQIHGTKDGTIAFKGSAVSGLGAYPGAETTVATWAQKNECATAAAQTGTTLKVNADSPAHAKP